MLFRNITPFLLNAFKFYPVIFLTGPRQSGKTTLLKHVFPDFKYISLENPDNLAQVLADPRSFLNKYQSGLIIDEAQNLPLLFSYIQGYVDENNDYKVVLSGSQNFLLNQQITQSLAGRVAIFKLLPLTITEIPNRTVNHWQTNFQGFYPALFDRKIPPSLFYSNYTETYLQRDVKQLINIGNLLTFNRFMKLLAGRAGQVLNLNSLGIDLGVDQKTVKNWLSILESSYIIYLVPQYFKNFSKRQIKSPKLFFYDIGLLCFLLNIKSEDQLDLHFMKGAIFENYCITELYKQYLNKGESPEFYFVKDSKNFEIDLIIENESKPYLIEIKSTQTFQKNLSKNFTLLKDLEDGNFEKRLLYESEQIIEFNQVKFLNLQQLLYELNQKSD